jgi:hypothetical protein
METCPAYVKLLLNTGREADPVGFAVVDGILKEEAVYH